MTGPCWHPGPAGASRGARGPGLRRDALLLGGLLALGSPAGAGAQAPIGASAAGSTGGGSPPAGARTSTKYLVASFPILKQVAYVHLPDNVWRPLVIGEVTSPQAVAVDAQNARLFVADPPNSVIWWYRLGVRANGLLTTVGTRRAAVENYVASWLAVNSVGDLYFTGREVTAATGPPPPISIFRQDAVNLATGDSLHPVEAYSRANTGTPDPKAWAPAGLAVDSFYLYWGNEQNGTSHGSIVKASHFGNGVLRTMSDAVQAVRGVTVTGTHVYFSSPTGVYGVSKSTPTTIHDANNGLVAAAPAPGIPWDPAGLAFDGESTLYLADTGAGLLYSLPASDLLHHNLTAFVDSPNVYGLAVIGFRSSARSGRGAPGLAAAGLALAAAQLWASIRGC